MAVALYVVCFLVALTCAALLFREYSRHRVRLLLWGAICFTGLAASNAMVFVDLRILTSIDLYRWRLALAAISTLIFLFGLIWDGQR